jgi:hypothetical protein
VLPGQPAPDVNDVEVATARDLWVFIHLSLRCASAARTRILGLSAPMPAFGGARVIVCKSTGDKQTKTGDMVPAVHWCLAHGMLPGVGRWVEGVGRQPRPRRKTVTAMDVVYALKRQGKTLYGFGG